MTLLKACNRYVVVFAALLCAMPATAMDVVKYSTYGRELLPYDRYYIELLKLVLDKSQDKFGEYLLKGVKVGKTQANMVTLIKHKKVINILWTMTSKEREQDLQPIRIPLFKGLGGCRIFLIEKDLQAKFSLVKDAEQLKALYAGQGADWPDTEILSANGFNVVKAEVHNSLYEMLAKGRFDYFPRAIHEAFAEVKLHPKLAVEQKLLISYPAPFFFFVNSEDERLASRLDYGLSKMIEDGSFDEFFNANPYSKNAVEQANIKARKVIELENPLLTEATQQALTSVNGNSACH